MKDGRIRFNNQFIDSELLTVNIAGINDKFLKTEDVNKIKLILEMIISFEGKKFEDIEKIVLETLKLETFQKSKFEGFLEISCKKNCKKCFICFACDSFAKHGDELNGKIFFRLCDNKNLEHQPNRKKNKNIYHITTTTSRGYEETFIINESKFLKELLPYVIYYIKYKI